MKIKIEKKTNRIEITAGTVDLSWEGVWNIKAFSEMLENAFNQANEDYQNTLTRYDFFFDKEWDYSDTYNFHLKMRLFRWETDGELRNRLHWEGERERLMKQRQEKEKEKERKKKEREKARQNDPEYQKYQELQKSLKKRKVI